MAAKLPKQVLEELDLLMEKLSKGNAAVRQETMARLKNYEASEKIPLEALLDMVNSSNMTVSMYGIMALGRNGSDQAVEKLTKMVDAHRDGNVVYLETLVDALGNSGNKQAAPALLELLGINLGRRKGSLLNWLGRNKGKDAEDENAQRVQEYLTLPVVRAVENLLDPMASAAINGFLDHSDPLVRWHTIQALLKSRVAEFNEKLQSMSAEDGNEMVREGASIALQELLPLPQSLNN